MNLAVFNTKTNQVMVFGQKRDLVASVTFGRALDFEEIEDFRKDPKGFLAASVTYDKPVEDKSA